VKFTPFGGNDYRQVLSTAVDQAGGRAFVTELAQPTGNIRPSNDETLKLLLQRYPYITRLYTRISPDEMTLDPVFDLTSGMPDVSNVHDLSDRPPPWNCDDGPGTFRNVGDSGSSPTLMAAGRYLQRLGQGGIPKGLAMFVIVALSLFAVTRRGSTMISAIATGVRGIRLPRLFPRLTRDAVILLFAETMVLQGVHEMEHIVQVVQRTALGISKGAGMLGSVFDIEPVHMIYNGAFLLLLGLVYVGCRRDVGAIPRNAPLVMRLLVVSFVFQIWHSVEHVVKMWQFFQTGLNGTPGILGYWIPVVYLHLGYNTLLYAPIVLAFFVGGFHIATANVLKEMVRGRPRQSRPHAAS
jgi:hypothetical protein